jgi:hypothetical protein
MFEGLEKILVHITGGLQIPQGDPVQTDEHQTAVQDIFKHLLNVHSGNVLTAGMWIDQALGKMCCMWQQPLSNLAHRKLSNAAIFAHPLYMFPNADGVLIQVSGPKPKTRFEFTLRPPNIFYNMRYLQRAGFEPEHILLKCPINPVQLCRDIFGTTESARLPKRLKYMLPGLRHMLTKAHKVPYGVLLSRPCTTCFTRTAKTRATNKSYFFRTMVSGTHAVEVSRKVGDDNDTFKRFVVCVLAKTPV